MVKKLRENGHTNPFGSCIVGDLHSRPWACQEIMHAFTEALQYHVCCAGTGQGLVLYLDEYLIVPSKKNT